MKHLITLFILGTVAVGAGFADWSFDNSGCYDKNGRYRCGEICPEGDCDLTVPGVLTNSDDCFGSGCIPRKCPAITTPPFTTEWVVITYLKYGQPDKEIGFNSDGTVQWRKHKLHNAICVLPDGIGRCQGNDECNCVIFEGSVTTPKLEIGASYEPGHPKSKLPCDSYTPEYDHKRIECEARVKAREKK